MAAIFNRFVSALLAALLFLSNLFTIPMKPFEPTPETPVEKPTAPTLCVDDYTIILTSATPKVRAFSSTAQARAARSTACITSSKTCLTATGTPPT